MKQLTLLFLLPLFFLLGFFSNVNAQVNFTQEWSFPLGTSETVAVDVDLGSDGFLYVLCNTNIGGTLKKMTQNGDLVWSTTLQNSSGLINGSFKKLSFNEIDNFIYIIGKTNDHSFILKYNNAGNFIWYKPIGNSTTTINAIDIDNVGFVYVIGKSEHVTNLASANAHQLQANGDSDMFLGKYDMNSNTVWATYYGGKYTDEGRRLRVRDNTIYTVSTSLSGNDMVNQSQLQPDDAGSILSAPSYTDDIVIAKFNLQGSFILGNSNDSFDTGYNSHSWEEMDVDEQGNLYVSLSYFGSFAPHLPHKIGKIIKFNSLGQIHTSIGGLTLGSIEYMSNIVYSVGMDSQNEGVAGYPNYVYYPTLLKLINDIPETYQLPANVENIHGSIVTGSQNIQDIYVIGESNNIPVVLKLSEENNTDCNIQLTEWGYQQADITYDSGTGELIGTNDNWSSSAVASEYLDENTDGILEFDISEPYNSTYLLGFTTSSSDYEYGRIYKGFVINNDRLDIHEEGGISNFLDYTLSGNNKLKIERRGDKIKYYIENEAGIELLRETDVSGKTLFVAAQAFNSGDRVPPLYLNRCDVNPCTPIIISDWYYSSTSININNGHLESTLVGNSASALGNSVIDSDGKLSFTIDNTDTYYTVGFTSNIVLPTSQMSTIETYNFMDYGWYVWNDNTCRIYERNNEVKSFDCSGGTQLSVERRGNKIQYRKDNILVWESDVDANTPLHSYSAIWNTIIPIINFSPCPTYDVITTYEVTTDFCSSTQSIELRTSPAGSYTYEWTSLETGSTNSGVITGNLISLPEGRYRVNTKLGVDIVDETIVNLHLGNSLNWSTSEAIRYDIVTNQLIGTNDNFGYAWSLSDEAVITSTPRKLSMIVSSSTDNYMLGLTESAATNNLQNSLPWGSHSPILESMDYGWYVYKNDGLAIYENGRQYTFPYEEGVKLSIERIGNQILYRKDDLLVYQSNMGEDYPPPSSANNVILHPHSIVWKTDKVPTIEYSCTQLDASIATIEIGSNSCTGTEVSIFPTSTSGIYEYKYAYLDVVPNLVVILPTDNPTVFTPPFSGKYNVQVTHTTTSKVQEFVIDISTTNWEEPNNPSNHDVTWALGTESLPSDKNGSVSFTIDRCASGYYQVGLSSTGYSSGDPDDSMEYGWYVFVDELRIYESGHVITVPSPAYSACTIGTNLSVEKINNTIYYYINGALFHTTENVTATLYPYYIQWSGYELPPISFTSCEVTTCDASPLLSISERISEIMGDTYEYKWYASLDRTIELGTGTEYTPDPLSNGKHVFTIVGTNRNDNSQYVITQTVNIEADIELLALTASPTAALGERFDIEGILGVNRDLSGISTGIVYNVEWFVDGQPLTIGGDYQLSSDLLTLTVSNFDAPHTYLLKLTTTTGACEIMLEKTITLRDDECTSSTPIPVFGLDLSKNYSFLELNTTLSASYYSTNEEGLLNFKYTERYKEGNLNVHIYNWERCEIGKVELTKKIGTNWYSLDLNEVCNESEYYVMEVFDENNRRKVLNFKYGFDDMKAKLVGDGWYCPDETLNYKVAIENGHASYVVELWGKRNGSTEWILLDVQNTENNDLTGSVANTSVNFPIQFTNMKGDAVLKAIVIDDWGNEVETQPEVDIVERPDCPSNERIEPPVASEKKGYKLNVRFSIRNLLQNVNKIFKTR